MSFKKNKIASNTSQKDILDNITSLREHYRVLKKKNLFSGMLLWVLALAVVSVIAIATLSKLPDFHFGFDFLNALNPMSVLSPENQSEKKINILLTGVGGGVHDGADLTDTIILASVNLRTKTVSMLSIPRDLYVEYPNHRAGKINELYAIGLSTTSSESKAMQLLSDKVSEMTGESIDYYVNVDFDGFVKFVDLLGWLSVDIPEELVDTEYPDDNWGYITFSIQKGPQVFDGSTALKYARSRHSTSDFDRSLRQQIIIKAIKEKLLEMDYITNPSKIKALYYTLSSHIKTNMGMKQILALALYAKDVPSDHIFSFNLNDSCFQGLAYCQSGGFLYTPQRSMFEGLSVLLPDGATPGNIGEYGNIAKFSNIICNYPEVLLDRREINIINATKVSGIANQFALMLKKFGFNVPEKNSIGSTKDPYEKSVILHDWDAETKQGIPPEDKTLEALSLFIFSEQQAILTPRYAKTPGDKIEIILSKDYSLFLP